MNQSPTSLRRSTRIAAWFCLILVVIADWLFYGQPVGWTAALFCIALVAAIIARGGRALRSGPGRLLILANLGLIAALIEYPGALTLWMISLGIVTLALFSRRGLAHSVPSWVRCMAAFFLLAWMRVFADARLVQRWRKSRMRRMVIRLKPMAQWFVAAGLSMVFVFFFVLANPVIEGWFVNAFDVVWNITDYITPSRVLLWIFVGMWSWALFRHRVCVRRKVPTTMKPLIVDDCEMPMPMKTRDFFDRLLSPDLITRCLVAFNVVFAVQTVLDMVFLFGGATLPDEMSYATYAHRGSYPLIATALLAGLFVLAAFRPGSSTQGSQWCRRLVYLWIGQNVFLTFNAFFRLSLYVDVYSLTRWRVAAAVWIGLVVLGLVWIAARILFSRSNRWLLTVNFFSAAAVLYVCCFLNFDGFIADYNVRHCREVSGDVTHARLDLDYLDGLGPESIPALRWLEKQTADKGISAVIAPHIRLGPLEMESWRRERKEGNIDELAAKIRIRLEKQLAHTLENWRGWCYRRHRLAHANDSVDAATMPGRLSRK